MARSSRVAEATTAPTSAGTWLGAAGTSAPLCRSGTAPTVGGHQVDDLLAEVVGDLDRRLDVAGHRRCPGSMLIVTLVAVAVSDVELTVPTGTPLSSTSKPG